MKMKVKCVSATLQHVYEDKIDADTGLAIVHPQTLQVQQVRLPDRQVVELQGDGVQVRLDGAFETIYETSKTYTVEVN